MQHARPRSSLTIRAILSLRWPTGVAIAFCAVAGVLLPAGFGMLAGIPEPLIHDEFSYLLGADTFAHGRLTNPAPPLPEFFEAPHVIVSPTYQSKYPPGQALVLAAGQRLMGHPIWGVWLSCGLFAGALCWMLQAWTSRHWALAITLISAGTLGTATYWAQSYWGGMLPASGGALLFGAVRRTLSHPRILTSSLMGLGLLVLLNTRPYEGVLLSLPAVILLARYLIQDRTDNIGRKLTRFILPLVAILAFGLTLMACYNRAVTGSFLQTPYDLHLRQYFHRGVFVFSEPRSPDRLSVPRVADFYSRVESALTQKESEAFTVVRNFAIALSMSLAAPFGLVSAPSMELPAYTGATVWLVLLFVVWRERPLVSTGLMIGAGLLSEYLVWLYLPAYPWILAPIVLPAWLIAFDRVSKEYLWARFVSATVLLFAAGQAIVWWWYPHYSAPVIPLVLAAIAASAQRLSRRSLPGAVYQLLPLTVAVVAANLLVAYTVHSGDRISGASHQRSGLRSRGGVARHLLTRPGDDLVFVKYDQRYPTDLEWVYNDADLTSSPTIFVHHRHAGANAALMAVYPGRSAWILHVSDREVSLSPYDEAPSEPERSVENSARN